ncbi:TPA: hypothetical protein ACJ509_001104 [Stenotrophomonas maltophilia]
MAKLLVNISLRFWHPTMSAAEIQTRIGLQSRFSRSVGDVRSKSSGDAIQDHTYVSMPLVRKVRVELDQELMRWCRAFEGNADFMSTVVSTGGRVEFYVSVFVDGLGGFEIDYNLLAAICMLNIGLSVEIYPPE